MVVGIVQTAPLPKRPPPPPPAELLLQLPEMGPPSPPMAVLLEKVQFCAVTVPFSTSSLIFTSRQSNNELEPGLRACQQDGLLVAVVVPFYLRSAKASSSSSSSSASVGVLKS